MCVVATVGLKNSEMLFFGSGVMSMFLRSFHGFHVKEDDNLIRLV